MLRLSAILPLAALLLVRPAFGEQNNTLTPRNLGGATMTEFAGKWSNEDQNTGIITHILVDQKFDKVFVRAWSRCLPTDCDWGTARTESSEAYYGIMEVEWHSRSSVRSAILTLGGRDRLRVKTKVHFTDNSGRSDYSFVENLVRVPEEASRKRGYLPASALKTTSSIFGSTRAADLSSPSSSLCPSIRRRLLASCKFGSGSTAIASKPELDSSSPLLMLTHRKRRLRPGEGSGALKLSEDTGGKGSQDRSQTDFHRLDAGEHSASQGARREHSTRTTIFASLHCAQSTAIAAKATRVQARDSNHCSRQS